MTTYLDISAIMQPIIAVIGSVLTGLIAYYLPKALAAFEKHADVQFTATQEAEITRFVNTSAGVLETKLDQGILNVSHIEIKNPTVLAEAQSVIAAAPAAANALNLTVDGVAKAIVGAINTAAHPASPTAIVTPVVLPDAEIPAAAPVPSLIIKE